MNDIAPTPAPKCGTCPHTVAEKDREGNVILWCHGGPPHYVYLPQGLQCRFPEVGAMSTGCTLHPLWPKPRTP